ncbi:stage V sporulation protein D [soil metagenome]
MAPNRNVALQPVRRIRVWYGLIILILAIFGLRLFYLQVIRYDHYKTAALSDQLKQYELPAQRGIITAYDGESSVPIVLNQTLYTVYADPVFIKHADKVAGVLADTLGGSPSDYAEKITRKGSRYVILAKKVSKAAKTALLKHELAGIGAQQQSYRVYPQGALASQLLGFVNSEGVGTYGIEQALDSSLKGTPGRLKAITDVHGIPLATNQHNISVPARSGEKVQLTIDLGMQKQMENILAQEYKKTKSKGLSAVIMDPYTGKVKAMANYPTYNPADTSKVKDIKVFQNNAVSRPIEPGSSMKPLTAAAALNEGAITPTTSYFDHAKVTLNGYTITNIEEDGGARQQNVQSVLSLSLNTGATWFLMRLGGSNDSLNMGAINKWHNYMTNHFRFSKATDIEQGYESPGYVPPTKNVSAIQLTYANTAFGQGVQVTALQMAGAYSSMLNGGTYYQPTLVQSTTDADGKTQQHAQKILRKNVVSSKVSREMVPLLQGVVEHYHSLGYSYLKFPSGYIVGGKTGSAQVASAGGGYREKLDNGTYAGFVGGNKPQYIVVVYNLQPDVAGYAGSMGGQPVFADLVHMLIDNGYVSSKH